MYEDLWDLIAEDAGAVIDAARLEAMLTQLQEQERELENMRRKLATVERESARAYSAMFDHDLGIIFESLRRMRTTLKGRWVADNG